MQKFLEIYPKKSESICKFVSVCVNLSYTHSDKVWSVWAVGVCSRRARGRAHSWGRSVRAAPTADTVRRGQRRRAARTRRAVWAAAAEMALLVAGTTATAETCWRPDSMTPPAERRSENYF